MTPFSWSNPYAWPRRPVLAENAVATSQPLAAQAGLQMLAAGGTALDAALGALHMGGSDAAPAWAVRAAYVGGITAASAAGVLVWITRRRLGLADAS